MATPAPSLPSEEHFLRVIDGGPTAVAAPAAQELLLRVAARAGLELAHAHRLEAKHSGDDHLDRLVAAIEGARAEVLMEMYQVRPDPVGWRVCTALAAAARRGVAVRLLLDSFGSARIRGWVSALRNHGVSVRWYNPWRPWRDPFHRTHRKLVVIDGGLASVGGINVAAEFSEREAGPSAWRDLALWLEGGAARRLRRQFGVAWTAHGGRALSSLPPLPAAGELCALAGPRLGVASHGPLYIALAASARRELLLATPYFLPDAAFRRAVVAAARRGVRVLLVVPRLSDLAWCKHASRRLYRGLLAVGVQIWERCDRMQHAKVAVVDGLVAAVGSANLNRQSFSGNSETLVLTSNPRVVGGVRDLITEESLAAAEAIDARGWLRHPDRRRLAELAALALAAIL